MTGHLSKHAAASMLDYLESALRDLEHITGSVNVIRADNARHSLRYVRERLLSAALADVTVEPVERQTMAAE